MKPRRDTPSAKRPVTAATSLAIALVLAAAAGCSSQESPAVAGPSGAGGSTAIDQGTGGAGLDRSCLDGSDWCVWSCSVGAESGSGDSPYPFCVDGQFRCPIGSQVLSTCPPRACARFDAYCCDGASGKVAAPACMADGTRAAVCPDGRDVLPGAHCVPDGVGVAVSCNELDGQACAVLGQECHLGGECRCRPKLGTSDGTLAWQCSTLLP